MNNILQKALHTPPDYSAMFQERVRAIGTTLSEKLHLPFKQETQMDYSAAQSLYFCLNLRFLPISCEAEEAVYALVFLLSSKGPYCTYIGKQFSPLTHVWTILQPTSPELIAYAEAVTAELEQAGFALLLGNVLDSIAEGHVTQLDSVPATVFQVLFSELY